MSYHYDYYYRNNNDEYITYDDRVHISVVTLMVYDIKTRQHEKETSAP